MAVVALKPRRSYSFTDHAVANPAAPPPGDRLDGEVDRIDRAIAQIIDFLDVSHNSDGTLKAQPPPPAHSLYTAPVGVLGPSADIHSIPGADPNALAMDWAEVSAEWAEHMPDTIPPNILAVMGVTGDHWSARWWAHRALEIVSAGGGSDGPARAVIAENAPSPASPGDLWWDTVSGQLFVFYSDPNSSQWVSATNQPQSSGAVVSFGEAPPVGTLTPGALWFDTAAAQLYLRYGDPTSSQWVPVVNQTTLGVSPALILTPGSGTLVPIAKVQPVYVNNPSLLGSLTLRLPQATMLGQSMEIGFAHPVTALTLQDYVGSVIPSAPTSAYGPGAAIQLRFEAPGWIYWK